MAKWIVYKGNYICSECKGHKICGVHPITGMQLTSRYCGWCGKEMENYKELIREQFRKKGIHTSVYYETREDFKEE